MTGIVDHNFPAFKAEADRLREQGYEVVNPADLNTPGTPWEVCLRVDIKALCDCDVLVLLPGWQNSAGANLEVHIAHRLKIEIQYARDFE